MLCHLLAACAFPLAFSLHPNISGERVCDSALIYCCPYLLLRWKLPEFCLPKAFQGNAKPPWMLTPCLHVYEKLSALCFCTKHKTCMSRRCNNVISLHLCRIFSTSHVMPVTQPHSFPEKAPKLLFFPSTLPLYWSLHKASGAKLSIISGGLHRDPRAELIKGIVLGKALVPFLGKRWKAMHFSLGWAGSWHCPWMLRVSENE